MAFTTAVIRSAWGISSYHKSSRIKIDNHWGGIFWRTCPLPERASLSLEINKLSDGYSSFYSRFYFRIGTSLVMISFGDGYEKEIRTY
jgi:hypothetical protein